MIEINTLLQYMSRCQTMTLFHYIYYSVTSLCLCLSVFVAVCLAVSLSVSFFFVTAIHASAESTKGVNWRWEDVT